MNKELNTSINPSKNSEKVGDDFEMKDEEKLREGENENVLDFEEAENELWQNEKVQKKLFKKLEEKGLLRKKEDNSYELVDINILFSNNFFGDSRNRMGIYTDKKKKVVFSKYRIIQTLIRSQIIKKEDLLAKDVDGFLKKYLFEQEKIEKVKKDSQIDQNKLFYNSIQELKKLGFLFQTKDGKTIVDINKLKKDFKQSYVIQNTTYIKRLYHNKKICNNNLARLFTLLFKDLQVVSKDDYEKGEKKEKPLLYMPNNAEDALDIEKIKQSEFYLSLHDLLRRGVIQNNIKYNNIEDINYIEITLALLIYHPNYGDAYRDKKTGKLMIKNDEGQYKPISAEYLIKKYGTFGKAAEAGDSLNSPRLFLRKKAPQLIQKKLLFPTDFRIRQKRINKERIVKNIGKNGYVLLNGVRHFLGRQFQGCLIYKINEEQGAIVNVDNYNNKQIIAYFNILNKNNAHKTKKDYYVASIQDTNPRNVKNDSLDQDETEEMKNIKNFSELLDADSYLQKQYNINIDFFSKKEQDAILKMMKQTNILKRDKFDKFVKRHGINGLKSFLSLESGSLSGDEIINIGKQLENQPKIADKLFSEYAQVIDEIEKITKEVMDIYSEMFPEEKLDKNKISQLIIKKANKLLSETNNKLNLETKDDKKENIINELINFLKRDLLIWKSSLTTFHNLKKELDDKQFGLFDFAMEKIFPLYSFETGHEEKLYNDYVKKMDKKTFLFFTNDFFMVMHPSKMAKRQAMLKSIFPSSEKNKKRKIIIKNGETSVQQEIDFNNYYISYDKFWDKYNIPKGEIIKKYIDFCRDKTNDRLPKDKKVIQEWKRKNRTIDEIKQKIKEEFKKLAYEENIQISKNRTIDKIFQKYQEIVDQTKILEEQINSFFKKTKNINEDEMEKIIKNILKKADDLLSDYIQNLTQNKDIDEELFITKLEKYKTDAVVFSSIFQTAREEANLSFEDIKNIDYSSLNSNELDEEEKEMIREIIRANYSDEKQREDILKKVEKSFQNGDKSRWHLLIREVKGKKELVSSLRFDEIDEHNVYGATFNVGYSYRGSNIGEAMFERVMGEVAKEKRVHAIAEIGKEVSAFYLERGGFNVSGIEKNKKTGRYYYQIDRFDPENELYGSKKAKGKDLLTHYDNKRDIKELIGLQKYILVKKEKENMESNIRDINYLLDNNYVMTRIIKEKKDNYLVFEKKVDMGMKEAV